MRIFQLAFIGLAMVCLGACATVGYQDSTKPVTNLNEFVSAAGLVQQGDDCLYVVNYRNGRTSKVNVEESVCSEAIATVAAERAAQLKRSEDARKAAFDALDAEKNKAAPTGADGK